MSSTRMSNDTATEACGAVAVPMWLEVVDGNGWLLQAITEWLPGRV